MLRNHLSDPNVADVLYANKVIKKLKLDNDYVLHFKSFQDGRSLKIVCYRDSAHNNLPKNGSQYGLIIFLCDSEETFKNPIAWRSARHDRVFQSSLAAECVGLQKAVDHAVFIQKTVSITLKNKVVPIECCIDNSSLNDLLHKTKDPEEKRLLCAMAPITIREMIERNEISLELIKSKKMPADILTKRGLNDTLIKMHLMHNV